MKKNKTENLELNNITEFKIFLERFNRSLIKQKKEPNNFKRDHLKLPI